MKPLLMMLSTFNKMAIFWISILSVVASSVCPVSRGTFDQECFLEMMAPLGYQAHDSMTVVVSCPRISWTCPEFFVLFRGWWRWWEFSQLTWDWWKMMDGIGWHSYPWNAVPTFLYHINLTILDEGWWGQRLPKVSKNLGQLLHASNIHQYLET